MPKSPTNESVDVRIARIEEAFKSQGTSLAKIELILEKLQNSITDRLHSVEAEKLDAAAYKNDRKDMFRYIDKVEENVKNQLETNSSLISLLEKYQIEQRGGYKYIIAALGGVSLIGGIIFTIIRITG